MKSFIIRSAIALFALAILVVVKNTSQAALDSTGHSITGNNITGANVASYTVALAFSGTLNTGDVVIVYLVGSWSSLVNSYTGAWWETGASLNFNASGLADGSVTLSGRVLTMSWALVTGSNITSTITKDSTTPTGAISYSYTGSTAAPVIATLTLSETGTITNNGWSWVRAFASNGSFTFTFQDAFGNTGAATATVSNRVYLWGGVTYIPYPVATENRVTMDYCPNGDSSPSRYDRVCRGNNVVVTGDSTTVEVIKVITVPAGPPLIGSIVNSPYSQELNQAYLYAFSIGMTTMPSILEANIKWHLTRAQMAKMITRYAMEVLWKELDDTRECAFSDINDQSRDLRSYIRNICQLGFMHGDMSHFNPNGIVTRAEFGTVLSRMLYGTTYEAWTPYYIHHLQALKNANIITDTDPAMLELRWHVMLMLMRASN